MSLRKSVLIRLAVIVAAFAVLFWPAYRMAEDRSNGDVGWAGIFHLDVVTPERYLSLSHHTPHDLGEQLLERNQKLMADLPDEFSVWKFPAYEFVHLKDRKGGDFINWGNKERNHFTFYYEEKDEGGKTYRIISDFTVSVAALYNVRVFPGSSPCSAYSEEELRKLPFIQEGVQLLAELRQEIFDIRNIEVNKQLLALGVGPVQGKSFLSHLLPYLLSSRWMIGIGEAGVEYCDKQYHAASAGSSKWKFWGEQERLFRELKFEVENDLMPASVSMLALYVNNVCPEDMEAIVFHNKTRLGLFFALLVAGCLTCVFASAKDPQALFEACVFMPKTLIGIFAWIREDLRNKREAAAIARAEHEKKLATEAEREEVRKRIKREKEERMAEQPPRPVPTQPLEPPPALPPVESNRERVKRLKREVEEIFPWSEYEKLWPKLSMRHVEVLHGAVEGNNLDLLEVMFKVMSETLRDHDDPKKLLEPGDVDRWVADLKKKPRKMATVSS